MKKHLLFVCLFAFNALLINIFAQEMTYSDLRDGNGVSIGLTLKSYEINSLNYKNELMHEISLSGIFIPNDEGMPNLPRISRFLAVPQGAEIRVSIKSMETETLQNINVVPALRIQAIPEVPVTDYVKNQKVYLTNDFYPQNPVEVSEITDLRGVNTIMVGITPFQFNPVTKELIVINSIELEIEYIGGTREYSDLKYRSPWFDPILKNALLNYEVLEDIEYEPKNSRSGTGCEYLIVIPNRSDFEPFAEQVKEFRTKQGIYTKVMRLDEMGVTTTTQLKTFFHNAYNTWDVPPVAVLLMGDHNTNMALGIPAETISHPYSGTCITDNQYADPTGNLLPDMVFGRMAAENETQMAVLVSKFLEYETQPCMEPSYYQNPITALGWQTERWFQICSETVGGYWRNMGKTPVRVNAIYSGTPGSQWSTAQNTAMVTSYFGPTGTGYIPASPTELGGWSGGTAQHVINAVNSGAFALQHRDHGFENGWGEPDFTIPNISSLTNVGKMTYVFTINCTTGKFNHSTPCFGEAFQRYTYQGQNAGCVGFLGPTEVSYSFVNDTYTWGMYDLYDPEFLPTYGPNYGSFSGPHAAYSGNWMPAFGNVSGKYFLHSSNWPYNTESKNITYQMFTPHSDVFLRLFTEVPQALTVNHAEVTLAGNANFLISANAGTLIALTAEIDGTLEILDVAVATGAVQIMTLPTTLIPNTEINVVITGQNYLRYENAVLVVPAAGPYIVPVGYSVVNEDILTYISDNSEIAITLKNVGVEITDNLHVTITTQDPQLTINTNSASCTAIAPDATANVNFHVTVANDIPDGKLFTVDVTVTETGKGRTWESKFTLKAFAPKFSLKKVLINDVEGGSLPKGNLVKITTVIENKGGADAYNVVGELSINDNYIIIPCTDKSREQGDDLPAGESMNLDFFIFTSPNIPYGHEVNIGLLIEAAFGRTYSNSFSAKSIKPTLGNACSSGNQNCGDNDKFVSVQILKGTTVLINNQSADCVSGGYQDYTHMVLPLEPGQQYTIKVKCGYSSQQIGGWFDLNGNNTFDANEKLITMTGGTSETTSTFTIPTGTYEAGEYRFRLVCKWNSAPAACSNSSYGQTHDYTITFPNTLPTVQNVAATLNEPEKKITVIWEAPTSGTPIGYNIYRSGNKLNGTTPLTVLTFTENNITEGIYVYNVTAVYTGNKESLAETSNVICNFTLPVYCEEPVNLTAKTEKKTAIITWEKPENIDGKLLKYNIYRDEIKIKEVLPTIFEYQDKNLDYGTYVYKICATYGHCSESLLTEGVTVAIVCEPPTNPSGTDEQNTAVITWNKPVNEVTELVGYNIYRNGDETPLNETTITGLEYRDEGLENGTYLYQITAVYDDECESELTEEVSVIIDVTGISAVQTATFQIFPNPAHSKLNIIGNVVPTTVRLYNITGQLVYETDQCAVKMNISVSEIPIGVYFIRITTESGTVTKKIVKQ